MGRAKQVQGQEDLIDVAPENQKIILKLARAYQRIHGEAKAVKEVHDKKRLTALDKLRAAIAEAGVTPMEDGSQHVHVDGYEIIVTPQNAKVKVKPTKDSNEDEGDEESED